MQAWLGVAYVDVSALWALFVAFAACAIQVRHASVLTCHVLHNHVKPCAEFLCVEALSGKHKYSGSVHNNDHSHADPADLTTCHNKPSCYPYL